MDAAFTVHSYFKSHTRATLTTVKGEIISLSKKTEKLNTKNSTESDLVNTDDVSSLILGTNIFLEPQGYKVE